MATYVNDLRLKEIATGDEAGTWGTSTNTNLQLIGEALGYGTQDCFASDADATTTVADGASDPARAMYFKVTSSASLTATRTLTIAPNTVSRVMFIENATTGSQSIAISQGSGGNVTIASGQTKMVYLDGAGATGAVVDALADLELGTITVANLTATTADINGGTIDGVTIGGSSAGAINGTTIDASTQFQVGTNDSIFAENNLRFKSAGAAYIDHNTVGQDINFRLSNASSLDVTPLVISSTGIDVTGTVTADGLTISNPGGSSARFVYTNNDQTNLRIKLENSGSGGNTWELVGGQVGANNADFTIYDATNTAKRAVFSNNGDISFYEDTGTTPKFFWDASEESLGVGTTSLVGAGSPLVTRGTTTGKGFVSDNGSNAGFIIQYASGLTSIGQDFNAPLAFLTNNTERMRIDSSGNVVIGSGGLDVSGIGGTYTALNMRAGGGYPVLYGQTTATTTNSAAMQIVGATSGASAGGAAEMLGVIQIAAESDSSTNATGYINFYTGSGGSVAERMRIDSSGLVAIGTSSPVSTAQLTVGGTSRIAPVSGNGLLLASGGSDRMFISTAGNVGIGTSSPAELLTITNSSGRASIFLSSGGTNQGYISYFNSTQTLSLGNAAPTGTGVNGGQQLNILSSGNVGIGTTSPSLPLHVVNSSTSYVLAETTGTGTSAGFRLKGDASADYTLFTSQGVNQFAIYDNAASAERMRIASDGGFSLSQGTGNNFRVIRDGDNIIEVGNYNATDGYRSTRYISSTHTFYVASAGAGSSSRAVDIDSSGNLLVGTTSSPGYGAKNFELNGGSGTNAYIVVTANSNAERGEVAIDGGAMYVSTKTNHPMIFRTNDVEKARIDTSGNLFVGVTTQQGGGAHCIQAGTGVNSLQMQNNGANPYGPYINFSAATPNNTVNYFIACADATATRAILRANGGFANYQSNDADLSDERTKKDITPAPSYWDKIGALEIVTYKYNDQSHDDVNVGVIAQQVETVEPVWVDNDGFGETPEGEEPLKTVYTKDITFAAIKALQEAMARIETLEAEVAALKGA
jgi:hypothetical protein